MPFSPNTLSLMILKCSHILLVYWFSLSILYSIMLFFVTLNYGPVIRLICWGKFLKDDNTYVFLRKIKISNRYFTHFYIIALLLMLFLIVYFKDSVNMNQPDKVLLILCSTIHPLIRLYECLFLTRFGSFITILHYLYGLSYYLALQVSIFLYILNGAIQERYILVATGAFLFVLCSVIQFICHRALKNLKTRPTYSPPQGPLFCLTYSPHYVAEILVIASYNLICGLNSPHLFGCLLATFLSLTIGILLNRRYYHRSSVFKAE